MAAIVIKTTYEEQKKVLKAVEMLEGKVVSVADLASWAGLNQSRARYALMDLVEQGAIERIPEKAFNKNYIRYSYKVVQREENFDASSNSSETRTTDSEG